MVQLIETTKTTTATAKPITDNQQTTKAALNHRTSGHNKRRKSKISNCNNNNNNHNNYGSSSNNNDNNNRNNRGLCKGNALSATTTTKPTYHTLPTQTAHSTEQSISNMVDRFVQSISQINDSGTFESSFEVKSVSALGLGLNSPQRVRHRCVTELDRQNLMRFVQNLEDRHGSGDGNNNNGHNSSSASSSAKNSPLLVRKALAIYQNAFHGSRSSSPKPARRRHAEADILSNDSGQSGMQSDDAANTMAGSAADDVSGGGTFQRAQPERNSLRSAAKMLQLFSAKRRSKSAYMNSTNTNTNTNNNNSNQSGSSSRCSSRSGSPVLLRTHPRTLISMASIEGEEVDEDGQEEEDDDDGISMVSSNGTHCSSRSRTSSPDGSLQLHAPLVPTFKVTPPQLSKQSSCRGGGSSNAANEFVRFLRGSFHAKRATIATLRRASSDPEAIQRSMQLRKPAICPLALSNASDGDAKNNNNNADNNNNNNDNNNNVPAVFKVPTTAGRKTTTATVGRATKPHILADTTNVIRTTNDSPLRRRDFATSSVRTPRSAKNSYGTPALLNRSASMSVSDNDVYTRPRTASSAPHNNFDAKHQKYFIMPSKLTLQSDGISKHSINNVNAITNANTCPASKLPQPKITKSEKCPKGVPSWSLTFENLLEDPAGLQTFSEFLKKEFSAENIYFWTACERFRYIESATERIEEAMNIFNRYLSDRAMEPVNIDSRARNVTQDNLSVADCELFSVAQKQIFNLMKFDSYQRFIRSDLYKSCLEASKNNRPLPFASESIDDLLKINFHQSASTKLKKSASNAEDRHRKSLLPWHRKSRSKSRDGNGTGVGGDMEKPSKLPQLSSNSLKVPNTSHNSNTDVHSSRSSLSSFDTFPGVLTSCNGTSVEVTTYPCRFRLNDNSTTMILPTDGETVDQLVKRLLEKRRLNYSAYNLIDGVTMKAIETHKDAQTLAGKEVLLEQRVAFKLYLPDPKVISVKSKPMKPLHEVVRSILERYNYSIDAVQVLRRETQTPLDLSLPVTVADGQHLEIISNKPATITHSNESVIKCPVVPKANVQLASNTENTNNTNKFFNELLQKREDNDADNETRRFSTNNFDLCSIKSDDCGSENSSVFDYSRKRDSNLPYVKKTKLKSCSSLQDEPKFSISTSGRQHLSHTGDTKQPTIIAKLKAGVTLQHPERVAEHQEELFEGLKRAQTRLEDQRGTEINAELPDFLNNKENVSAASSKLRKLRANLSPVSKVTSPSDDCFSYPLPAPRLSIANKTKAISTADNDEITLCKTSELDLQAACSTTLIAASIVVPKTELDEVCTLPASEPNSSNSSMDSDMGTSSTDCKAPPPLPPKPKILPIKPSNWSAFGASVHTRRQGSTTSSSSMNIAAVEPSSSFV